MFDEINKYKQQGHFFFEKGKSLKEQSRAVPELPGVYYILRLAKGGVDLVYIGKSGTVTQTGKLSMGLKNHFDTIVAVGAENLPPLHDKKIEEENIDALDIYWFVTMDKTNNDLPGYVEGLLMQRYFDVNEKLPPWNKCF